MRVLRCHAKVTRSPRDFNTGVVRSVVPNQTMSLKEMLLRFVRREALPVEREGYYFESEHDVEKLAKLDPTEKAEVLEQVKESVKSKKAKVEKAQKDHEDAIKAEAAKFSQTDPKIQSPPSE